MPTPAVPTIESKPPAVPMPVRAAPAAAAGSWRRQFNDISSSWLSSFLLHATLLLLLTLFAAPWQANEAPPLSLVLDIELDPAIDLEEGAAADSTSDEASQAAELGLVEFEVELSTPIPQAAVIAGSSRPAEGVGQAILPEVDWLAPTGTTITGGLRGRTQGMKQQLLAERGGTRESEDAVERGLRWLQAHQRPDGSWRFNHFDGPCNGHCSHPGNHASTTAATALALLPFYGAGHTHREGDYQETVAKGLYYLGSQMIVNEHGGDLQQGTMYAQGIAAILLCEAYAMTGDENLRDFAQAAIDYIAWAQHPKGGWRYNPGQPGDLTSTAWQFMAIKSAQMSDLDTSSETIYRVSNFLDSLESEGGAQYGYQTVDPRRSTTAIGLLCRMYLGWQRENESLQRGAALLDRWGPSPDDMYYNYYATQVMSHYGGPAWERWNERMREQLIRDQATVGHEAGSWYYDEQHARSGGRLYNTAMAIMTLEVYYRYMPLYAKDVTREF